MEMMTRTPRPRATIILIHGMGDHGGALPYRLISGYLLSKDYQVFHFDLPGHGEHINDRPAVRNWQELADKCKIVTDKAIEAAGERPVFLVGLSLGGLIALNYASKFPGKLRGVIAASPALDTSGVPKWLQVIVRMISGMAPGLRTDVKLDLKNISRDTEAIKEYTGDKLWQTKTSAGFAASVLDGIRETRKLVKSLRIPVFLLQGTADKIVPNEGGVMYYGQIPGTVKELKQYPGFFHNLFLEPERELIFGDIETWISGHIQDE